MTTERWSRTDSLSESARVVAPARRLDDWERVVARTVAIWVAGGWLTRGWPPLPVDDPHSRFRRATLVGVRYARLLVARDDPTGEQREVAFVRSFRHHRVLRRESDSPDGTRQAWRRWCTRHGVVMDWGRARELSRRIGPGRGR